jgi:hypothetical protein
MMQLVFVHGMRQEHKVAAVLKNEWEKALASAWNAAGLTAPLYSLEMPFYGDVLNDLVEEVRGKKSAAIVGRGDAEPGTFTSLEEDIIREMAAKEGITDLEVRGELSQEVVARGPANWEWVQGLARVLERKVPGLSGLGLGWVRQVDGYLTRPHIQQAVDGIVEPSLLRGRTVVVAHSLGTIVAYRLLRKAGNAANIPLFVTVGSPLAIATVKQHIRPPSLQRPLGVTNWLNGTDERDYVALYSRLDRNSFAEGIENLSDIHNPQSDAHSIVDYLTDAMIAQRIHSALQK